MTPTDVYTDLVIDENNSLAFRGYLYSPIYLYMYVELDLEKYLDYKNSVTLSSPSLSAMNSSFPNIH